MKSLSIIFSCIICIVIFQAFSVSHEPKFKNLKILSKDISEHDLDSVMHHFSQALGVKCNFCHVRNEDAKKMDFVSDAKPEKGVARKMMLMAIDINKNYFKGMEMDHDMDNDMNKERMNKNKDSAQEMGHHNMNSEKRDMNKERMIKNKDSAHEMEHHRMDHDMNNQKMDSAFMNDSRYMLLSVTCYTCHHGDAHPDSKMPPGKEGPGRPESNKSPGK